MKINFRSWLKAGVGLGITLLAAWLFLKTVDVSKIGTTLRAVEWPALLAAAVLTLVSFQIRAFRLSALLPAEPGAIRKGFFSPITIAFMANNLLPARLGEAARVFLVYKKNRFSLHASLGSLIWERAADSFFYSLCILVPALVLMPVISGARFFGTVDVMVGVRLAAIAAIVILAATLLYRLFPEFWSGLLRTVSGRLKGRMASAIDHLLRLISASSAWLFHAGPVARVILLTPLAIGCYSLIIWCLARGLHLSLAYPAALFASGIIAFGVAVPSSPGYIGTLHLALREALVVFGIDVDSASALAVLYHLVTWAVTVAAGLFCYFRSDFTLKELRTAKEERTLP